MSDNENVNEKLKKYKLTVIDWENAKAILTEYKRQVECVVYDGFDTNVENSSEFKFEVVRSGRSNNYINAYIKGFIKRNLDSRERKLVNEYSDEGYGDLLEKYIFTYPKEETLIKSEDFLNLRKLVLSIPQKIIPSETLDSFQNLLNKHHTKGSASEYSLESYILNKEYEERSTFKIFRSLKEIIDSKNKQFKKIYDEQKKIINSLEFLKDGNSESIQNLVKLANYRHFLPKFFKRDYDVYFDESSKILLIEFEFPDYKDIDIPLRESKSRGTDYIYASKSAKKKIISETLYSLIIRSGFLASSYLPPFLVELIVINVRQKWFDPATGNNKEGTIATVQGKVDDFKNLNLSQIDPEACIRNLKGIVTSSLEKINPVRPIYQLNKEDKRFIKSKQVDSNFEQDYNLAAMPWEDFEHLVAQLFEWEFAKGGIEVRVTRASRDRGVDAILFDPDPLKGGKYVLQAKRYTNVVDVSSVRDLYGTVMNEGANRGILITTSSYGPDAYEFVKDKPISLVDGPNLLLMLEKHGRKFSIDLIEAKRILKEDDI